jgi:hypothetical protein
LPGKGALSNFYVIIKQSAIKSSSQARKEIDPVPVFVFNQIDLPGHPGGGRDPYRPYAPAFAGVGVICAPAPVNDATGSIDDRP